MYQDTALCVVYLNGEYWGCYNMRERVNTISIAQWEGWTSDPEKIDLVKANTNVMQGSNETYEELRDWVEAFTDRKSTRLNSSHMSESRMPSSA